MMINNNYFLSRLHDLDQQAESYYMITYSSFLDLHEQKMVISHQREFTCSHFILFGGHEMAERQMIAFIPDDSLSVEFPIQCLKILPKHEKYADSLTHRDYLGAILNTGIERKLIGDIFIQDHVAYLLCVDTISDYMIENLNKIKHTTIQVEKAALCEIQFSRTEIICSDTIASNRLDCIVSSLINLSRQKAQSLIKKEEISIDHQIETRNDVSCPIDCIISIRGYGRFRIQEIGSQKSKKGKLRLTYIKYI